MGQIEATSSLIMAKSSNIKKASSGSTKGKKGIKSVDFADPKVQAIVGLLAILVLLLWYGFKKGCFRYRRRRSC